MTGDRLIVATDRSPISFGDGERLRMSRGPGGVVSALRDFARLRPVTWAAPAVSRADRRAAAAQAEHGGLVGSGRLALRLVPIEPAVYADHRRAFADRVLWFAQHGLWRRRVEPEPAERLRWLAARAGVAASAFADALASELHRPGHSAAVLVHDYQLYLVPAALRARVPGARIAHFTHIPWPELATWREALPRDVLARLVRGILAADVAHFQTRASADAFRECVDALVADAAISDEWIRHRGGATLVRVRPVSVDPASLRPRADRAEQLRADPRALIVRVDRSDPIKNIPAGFRAFETMLERHPHLAGRVRFVARVVPSRTTLPEYVREVSLIRNLAERISQRFGAGTIELIERQDRGRALAELAAADVVLVNSLRDGMNLVAKEAVAVGRPALVLSRRAGAYEDLGDHALGVDPEDIDGTAEALRAALEMPPRERLARANAMRARVMAWTSRDWLRAQLEDLAEAARPAPPAVAASA